jgi:hypothetical protein
MQLLFQEIVMENTTSRKVWETPKVFVLGAESTQGFQVGGENEVLNHITGLPDPYKYLNSQSTFEGYES